MYVCISLGWNNSWLVLDGCSLEPEHDRKNCKMRKRFT